MKCILEIRAEKILLVFLSGIFFIDQKTGGVRKRREKRTQDISAWHKSQKTTNAVLECV
jgi:hypothetical protein